MLGPCRFVMETPYRQNTTNTTTQNWRCKVKGCNGSATNAVRFQIGGTVIEKRNHSHPPDPARVEILTEVNCFVGNNKARSQKNYKRNRNESRSAVASIEMKSVVRRNCSEKKTFGSWLWNWATKSRKHRNSEKFRTVKHGVTDVRFLLYEDY